MEIEVKLYANLQDYYPDKVKEGNDNSLSIVVEPGSNLSDLMQNLNIPEDEVKMTFINNRKQLDDYELQDGDTVAIFPPIAGG